MAEQKSVSTELEVTQAAGGELLISGNVPNLHDSPEKIHQLLDLLGLPKGTSVRVTTKATSVIVR
jgi:hypothetical protein